MLTGGAFVTTVTLKIACITDELSEYLNDRESIHYPNLEMLYSSGNVVQYDVIFIDGQNFSEIEKTKLLETNFVVFYSIDPKILMNLPVAVQTNYDLIDISKPKDFVKNQINRILQICLLRRAYKEAQKEVEEAKVIKKALANANVNSSLLVAEIEEANEKIQESHFKIKSLVDNLKQAVFTIDSSHTIIDPVSKYTKEIFGEEILGKKIFDTVFSNLDRNGESFSLLKSALITVFDEGSIQWDLVLHCFPSAIKYMNKETFERKSLKINTIPLWNDQELVSQIMFVVEDITSLELLERERNEKQTINSIIIELSENTPQNIADFFKSARTLIFDADELIKHFYGKNPDFKQILLNLHTFKGNARLYNLSRLSESVHRAEQVIIDFRDGDATHLEERLLIINKIRESIIDVRRTLYEYAIFAKKIFHVKISFDHELYLEISAHIYFLINQLDNLFDDTFDTSESQKGSEVTKSSEKIERVVNDEAAFSKIEESLVRLKIVINAFDGVAKDKDIERLQIALRELRSNPRSASSMSQAKDCFHKIMIYMSQLAFSAIDTTKVSTEAIHWNLFVEHLFILTRTVFEGNRKSDRFIEIISNAVENVRESFNRVNIAYSSIFTIALRNAFVNDQDSTHLKDHVSELWAMVKCIFLIDLKFLIHAKQLDISNIKNQLTGLLSYDSFRSAGLDDSLWSSSLEYMEINGFANPFPRVEKYSGTSMLSIDWDVYLDNDFVFDGFLFDKLESEVLPWHCKNFLEYRFIRTPWTKMTQAKISRPYLSPFFVWHQIMSFIRAKCPSNDSLHYDSCSEMIELCSASIAKVQNSMFLYIKDKSNPSNEKNLYNAIRHIFYLPVRPMFERIEHMALEIGRSCNKNIRIVSEDNGVFISRELLKAIEGILVQTIRNCIDHGIEPSEMRSELGKPAIGTIRFAVKKPDNELIFEIEDDGKGIDIEKLANRARSRSLLSEHKFGRLSDEEKILYLLRLDISSKDEATDISGRGVGTNIVFELIDQFNGDARVHTEQGVGSKFTFIFNLDLHQNEQLEEN